MKRKSKIEQLDYYDFKLLIENSTSIMEVLEKLGYKNKSGTMHNIVKSRIKRENISISHMNKLNNDNNKNGVNKIPLEDIMIENSTYTNKTRLKIRLINEKLLVYKCEICGNNGEWNNKPIVLHLDHKNGVNNDHRLNNLRFLCPNCHSQTETYSGKNYGKYIDGDIA